MVGERVDTDQTLGTARSSACITQVNHLFPSVFVMAYESQCIITLRNTNSGSGCENSSLGLIAVNWLLNNLYLRVFICKVEMRTVVAISLGSSED